MFFFVSVFSVVLLLPASVCCFSFLLLFLTVAAVVGGAMVVLLCGGGPCLLLFFCLCRGAGSFFSKGVAAGGGRWLEVDGGAAGDCWPVELLWRWRGRNNGGAQGMRNGSSSSLCRDRSLYFSVFFFLSLLRLFFYFWTMMVVSGVTGRNSGGDGGGYADRSRWFFLSSVSLLVSTFSVLSLSLHPQNSSVRSSLSHQKFPLFLSFSLPKNPPNSVVCFSLSPKFCPPHCWFLLWYL
jgi:hypothetical protein